MESHATSIPNWKIQLILQMYLLKLKSFSLLVRMYQLQLSSFPSFTYIFLSLLRIMEINFKGRVESLHVGLFKQNHIFSHKLTEPDDLETQLWKVYSAVKLLSGLVWFGFLNKVTIEVCGKWPESQIKSWTIFLKILYTNNLLYFCFKDCL